MEAIDLYFIHSLVWTAQRTSIGIKIGTAVIAGKYKWVSNVDVSCCWMPQGKDLGWSCMDATTNTYAPSRPLRNCFLKRRQFSFRAVNKIIWDWRCPRKMLARRIYLQLEPVALCRLADWTSKAHFALINSNVGNTCRPRYRHALIHNVLRISVNVKLTQANERNGYLRLLRSLYKTASHRVKSGIRIVRTTPSSPLARPV